jgi:hypothetical protein
MSGVAAVVLGAVLLAVFLLIMAVMLWQEARSRATTAEPVYGTEDATDHAMTHVPAEVRDRLGRDNVRRILEWQVAFLQGLARDDQGLPIVVGSTEGTVEHIRAGLARKGHPLAAEDIAAVLETQGGYLEGLGLIGEPADPGEVFGDA